jgi:hypothetical protein
VVRDLREVLRGDDILVSDVGTHKLWIARMYPCTRPNTCIISNGFASMGIALPGAIGAKLLYPNRRVLAACGDGGFLMNVQELETAVRVGTPIVSLIFEDSAYGVIKWNQLKRYGRPAFVDYGQHLSEDRFHPLRIFDFRSQPFEMPEWPLCRPLTLPCETESAPRRRPVLQPPPYPVPYDAWLKAEASLPERTVFCPGISPANCSW